MANSDIKMKIKESNLKQWQIAENLKINEFVFSRKMRYELPEEEKKRVLEAIEQLKKGEN